VLAGCGSGGFSRVDAVEAFQAAHPDASTTQAACVIDALIEEYETEPVDASALDGLEAELVADPQSDAFVLDQFRAQFGCGMTADVEAQLRRELLANDLAPDAVDCVASELATSLTDEDLEVLINDQMTDSFYATFFRAVEVCDALP
jgi:hypothetical protein